MVTGGTKTGRAGQETFRTALYDKGGPMQTPRFAAAAAVLFVVLAGVGTAAAKLAASQPATGR